MTTLPLLMRCAGCQYLFVRLLAPPMHQWSMPSIYLLTAAVAAGLPLLALLVAPSSYHGKRDRVLAVTQALLLVMLRRPLLAAAAAGVPGTVSAATAAAGGLLASAQLFHACIAALLLLLFRQRLSWAAWQAAGSAVLGLGLLCWEQAAAGGLPVPAMGCVIRGLLHALLPMLVLPMLYLQEKVDRCVCVCAGVLR